MRNSSEGINSAPLCNCGELEEIGRSEFGPGKTGRRTPELNLGEVIEVGGGDGKTG